MLDTCLFNGKVVFKRMYICYKGCIDGFNEGCRPVIGLDGYHINGHHTGQLLIAIRVDATNNMFPIAYVVVESKYRESSPEVSPVFKRGCEDPLWSTLDVHNRQAKWST